MSKMSPKATDGGKKLGVGKRASLIQWIRRALNRSDSRRTRLHRKVDYYDGKRLQLFFAEFDVKCKLARG